MIWLVPILLAVLLASGLGLAYVVGATAVVSFLMTENARYLAILPQKVFSQISVFALLSMPLFILAGELMNRGGVTKALIDVSMAMVGRIRGGLGHVNIMTSVFFAGISGSAVADAASLSNTLVPAMEQRGYTRLYAGAITAASSIIGPIVPPSIILIFYGAIMQTSVAALFVAGILPGLLLACALFALNGYYAVRDDHPRIEKGEAPPILPAIARALPALLLPLIIVGGIVLGWMTPTEAAAVAVIVAALAAIFYEGLKLEDVVESLRRTAMLTGSIFVVLCAIAAFGHLASLEKVPQAISALITDLGLGPVGFMLAMNLLFILAGMFLDIPMALALLVPLVAPVALANGADPVHLGIVICFNLTIGLVSPPMGGCLLIVSTVTGLNYWTLARAVIPFVLVEILVLGVLVFVPEISLYLPRAFGLWN
ncbi:TRAP transporter large permease [Ruegeria pomeroyi]|uniref:TRAP transporter large permease protein n=1 Tax=Ruegeria aquimaris TaxID=2984333 RepID=A0ABT3ALB0_9RHOB|nr:TRAP transporter large permease [Ruegeria sp. XHP0148]MCE8514868.1 TRAP transporter large permease [Ruegeria pomeroyi]MCE8523592.1 TRAP transporter large permease [Ruegeria pomeroyi]MCE8531557.1 TRAP transporter large permease [Ruegeria pomeroyi]MCV2889469.1 TRAP transporter large permease [Ruegeria sp. XHP0148]